MVLVDYGPHPIGIPLVRKFLMGAAASLSAETRAAIELLPAAVKAELTLVAEAALGHLESDTTHPNMLQLPSFPCDYPMLVMPWCLFEKLNALPRSDEAAQRKLLIPRDGNYTCIFVSHMWWQRSGDTAAPDFSDGKQKGLKFQVICRGVRALIEREDLDPARLTLWCDWFSIDQCDGPRKEAGVRSMIYYVTQCNVMLIPLPTEHVVTSDFRDGADPDDYAAYYPEDVADCASTGPPLTRINL